MALGGCSGAWIVLMSDFAHFVVAVNRRLPAINLCFAVLFGHLQRGKQLLPYKLDSGHYLMALDGSQYFSSDSK